MSEEQSDKLKLNLKTTDTNRFKIEADLPTEKPADKIAEGGVAAPKIDDLEAQRKVNTGSFKKIDVTGQAPSSTTVVPGVGDGGIKKSETVRLKVVRATPAGAPAASPAASTVKLNLRKPDEPAPAAQPTAQTSTLKLRPTTPAATQEVSPSAADTATTKVPLAQPSAAPAHSGLSLKKEEAPAPAAEKPAAAATVAVEPPKPAEAPRPALKLGKAKKEAAATVAVEPPAEAKPAEEKKEEPPKPAMKMKGAAKDDVQQYLPSRDDDDEPGAFEGVAALIAFLGTGFATYQLVMNFLQQIQ